MADDILTNLANGFNSVEKFEIPTLQGSDSQNPDHQIEIGDDPSRQGPLLRSRKKNKEEEKSLYKPKVETSKRWTIFRVPAHIREVDEKAYDPKIVSIGPLHCNKPCLKAMEAQKLRFVNRILEHVALSKADLERPMHELEGQTRECYSENFEDMSSNEFIQMMVLDACFIVELLRLYEKSCEGKDVEEPIFGTRSMIPIIVRDLLMLENQLPMFVLQRMYDLLITNYCSTSCSSTTLNKLALRFFEPFRLGRDEISSERLNTTETYSHLLDLFQSRFVPSPDHPSMKQKETWSIDDERLPGKGWINNATKLTFAGIELRGKSSSPLLDLNFHGHVLEIPTLFLDDGSGPLLRNLLAFEQSNRYAKPYFTCLAIFFDSIVDTTNDINILRNAGVIKQAKGGNDEILQLLNSLTRELEFDMEDCYITEQVERINLFCRTTRARIRTIFRTFIKRFDILNGALTYISLIQTIVFILASVSGPDTEMKSAQAPAPSA
ncbi:UPF0481 protein At3g47200 [Ziziphus jujuba]|uniref:UPF0481 protein At3g47200 n=1 Tax=Ziziphus jujuba TaxID=326968 RepID=A0ABM3IF37_ZIZJJ|nr:UPF0481 protein At3g47200 [Ziziphus jujuba]